MGHLIGAAPLHVAFVVVSISSIGSERALVLSEILLAWIRIVGVVGNKQR